MKYGLLAAGGLDARTRQTVIGALDEMLESFDRNHDSRLNQTERKTLEKAIVHDTARNGSSLRRRSWSRPMRTTTASLWSASGRELLAWCDLDDVKAAVANSYGCGEKRLLSRHSRDNEARQVLLYLAATHCHMVATLSPDWGRISGRLPSGR